MTFEPLSSRVLLDRPDRLSDRGAWQEHIPFAFLAVELQRPEVLVELGTWRGDSYCAFCQAVSSLSLPTRCYAVDTWAGDEHTGAYPAEEYEELKAYHDPRYGAFSRLVRSTFDDALAHFPDGGVDLLHIDGYHTYDAVRHDFEAWRPKLSDRALVLLHDTNVREKGFGVWGLWEELAPRHPSFAFTHGHGLGVLAVGARPEPAVLDFLTVAREREAEIRSLFHTLGAGVALQGTVDRLRAELGAARRASPGLDEIGRVLEAVRRHLLEGVPAAPTPAPRPSEPPAPQEPAAPEEPGAPQPLFSIVMPVHDPPAGLLRQAIDSVTAQTYPRWELCICDDASETEETASVLARAAAEDERIRVVRAESNLGISGASNLALTLAGGDFVALLDHDDELAPEALSECAEAIARSPGLDVLYSDEDKLDPDGDRTEPFYKPDWSPHFFRGVMYVGHLLVVRRALVEEIEGFDAAFDGVQDYELMLRLGELTEEVEHLPRTLYHWRKAPGSIAADLDAKADVPLRQAAAVSAHLERCGVRAIARPHPRLPHRVELAAAPRDDWPDVTIVVASAYGAGLDRCLESIARHTTYPGFDVVAAVGSGARMPAGHDAKLVSVPGPFDLSRAFNAGVAEATGDAVVLLDARTKVVTPDWLEELVWPLEQADVGAVGPLLLLPNLNVSSAGVALGRDGATVDVMRGFARDADGYAGSLACLREVSAVRVACMALLRDRYFELGGLSEDYRRSLQDVDLCLRIREAGGRVLWTPRAVLVDAGDVAPAEDPLDRALFLDVWGEVLERGDPHYSSRLSLERGAYAVGELVAS